MRLTRHHAGATRQRDPLWWRELGEAILPLLETPGTGFMRCSSSALFYGSCGPVQGLLPTHQIPGWPACQIAEPVSLFSRP